MSLRIKIAFLISLVVLLGVFVTAMISWKSGESLGASLQFRVASSATASTSVVYMTPGTATSTATLDAYEAGAPTGFREATLRINAYASSTATTFLTTFEVSHNGNEWFFAGNGGTTTDISIPYYHRHDFASTSPTIVNPPTGIAASQGTGVEYFITVHTPLRYIRAKTSLSPSSQNGTVWSEFVGVKEN